jgi:hypothetical protein
MVQSNSSFLNVRNTPSASSASWELYVYFPSDNYTQVRAIINDYVSLTGGPALCDTGVGSVTLDLASPLFKHNLAGGVSPYTLLSAGVLWRAYEDGEPRFEWISSKRTVKALSQSNEPRHVQVSGYGSAVCLKWPKVFPPGFPNQTAFFWTFKNQSRMQAWYTLLNEAQLRGTVTFVDPTFTATADSAGMQWMDTPLSGQTQPDYVPDLNTDLLSLLNTNTGQSIDGNAAMRAEWVMWPGFKLDVRRVIGSHLENKVIFNDGASVLDREEGYDFDEVANYIGVRDAYGETSVAKSTQPYGQIEYLRVSDDITNQSVRSQVANITLEIMKEELSSRVIKVLPNAPNRRVFVDYNVGDWVGVDEFNLNTGVSTVNPYRVMGITISKTSDTYEVELVLQSRLAFRLKELNDRIARLIATGGSINGAMPTLPSPTYSGFMPDYSDLDQYGLVPYNGQWMATPITQGGGGGCTVYIQNDEPTEANIGDFWYDTSYLPED